jgi:hypothetical protein
MITPITRSDKSFFAFVTEFVNVNGNVNLVPCRYDPEHTTKKPSCFTGNKTIDVTELIKKPPKAMVSVALALTEIFLVFDMDGTNAVEYVSILEESIGALPDTYHVARKRGEREAKFFRIPEAYKSRINYKELNEKLGLWAGKDKLEIRTGGNQYQVFHGTHPSGALYKQLSDTLEIAELPIEWCEFLATDNLDKWINEQINATLLGVEIVGQNGAKVTLSNSTNSNSTYSKDSVKDVDIEAQLCYAKSMIETLVAFRYRGCIDYDFSQRENLIQIGMLVKTIDDGLMGSWELWEEICNWDASYDLSETPSYYWKDFKVGDSPRLKKYGSLVADFKLAFQQADTAAKNETDSAKRDKLSTVVEGARGLYSDVQGDRPLSQSEFYEWLYNVVCNVADIDIDSELRKYSQHSRIYYNVLSDGFEKYQQNKAVNFQTIVDAIAANTHDIDFSKIYSTLPNTEPLAKILKNRNYDLGVSLMFLLSAIGSVSRKDRLAMFDSSPCPVTLFSVLNGESGKGKSPLIKTFTNALTVLDTANRMIDVQNMKEYQERKREQDYERKNNKAKPEFGTDEYTELTTPNELRNYTHQKGSIEALEDLQSVMTDYNLAWVLDEIVQVIKITNGYSTNTKTSDAFASLIEMWNGEVLKKRTKKDGVVFGTWGVGLVGGIQPDVIDKAFNLNEDSQGFIARLLIMDGTNLQSVRQNPNQDVTALNCDEFLIDLYIKVSNLPGGLLKPSDSSWQVWEKFDRECQIYSDSPNIAKGFSLWLRKIAQQVARIAANLHTAKVALGCTLETSGDGWERIDDESVYQAIDIGRWLIVSHAKLFGSFVPTKGLDVDVDPETSQHISYLLNYLAKQNKVVTLNKICKVRHFADKKMRSGDVKPILDGLVSTGKVDFIPGKGYIFTK